MALAKRLATGVRRAGVALGAATLLVVCGGCDSCSRSTATAAGGANSAPLPAASATTTARASATVDLIYEGQAKVPLTVHVGERLLLREQLPENARDPLKWRGLRATAMGKRELALRRYGEVYGGSHDVYIYLDDKQQPKLGLFRRITADMPETVKKTLSKPHLSLTNVQTVEVRTSEVPTPEEKLASLDIDITGASTRIAGERIAALEPFNRKAAANGAGQSGDAQQGKAQRGKAQRGNAQRRNARRGWLLSDVVALASARVPPNASVTVYGEGNSKQLTAADLSNAEIRPLLRYNRRGMLVFELWRKDDKQPSERLNSVHKLVVTSGS